MEYAITDYLFILSLYNEPISLDRLLFHLPASEPAGENRQLRADLRALEKTGMVALDTQEGTGRVCITPLGRRAADALASVAAETMVSGWQYRTPRLHPSEQPA